MKRIAFLMVSMLAGCAAIPLNPGAERVIVSRTPAPRGCAYRGSVVGKQGDFFTGGLTANDTLAEGAMNDLRNKAEDLGANYVVLETNQAGMTFSGGRFGTSGQQTDVTNTGNAYLCRPEDIGLAPLSTATRRQEALSANAEVKEREKEPKGEAASGDGSSESFEQWRHREMRPVYHPQD